MAVKLESELSSRNFETEGGRPTRTRFVMLGLILLATTINYIGRSNLSIVAPLLSKQLKIDDVKMGLLLSAFSWTYALATLPGGWIVDRLGVRWMYGLSQLFWAGATFFLGFANGFSSLFALRMIVGLAESPAFPANNRVVTMWFPQKERGMATGTYVMGQYIGTGLLARDCSRWPNRSAGGRCFSRRRRLGWRVL